MKFMTKTIVAGALAGAMLLSPFVGSGSQSSQLNPFAVQTADAAKSKYKYKAKSGWTSYTATYYNLNGRTASGKWVKHGVTIAVDPRYIPLGTWVEIKYPNGKVERRQAQDTGRLIKGHKIDIYSSHSTKELMRMGKHKIQVRILK